MKVARKSFLYIGGLIAVLSWLWAVPVFAKGGAMSWQRAHGPWGGMVRVLVVDPQQPGILYAGTPCGVYKSSDTGVSWSRLGQGEIACLEVKLLALDPLDPQILYAVGTGDLFRTNDAGTSWTRVARDLAGQSISALTIDHALPGVLYVAVRGMVFRSGDYGDRWQAASAGLPGEIVWSLVVHPLDSRKLYAGTNRGLFVSNDSGATWTGVANGPQGSIRTIAVDRLASSTLYLGTEDGFWRSVDEGASWQPTEVGQALPVTYLSPYPGTNDALLSIQASREIVRSDDGGTTWSPLISLSANQFALAVVADPFDPRRLYLGTSHGLYTSSDGGETWMMSMGGLGTAEVRQVVDVPGTTGEFYVVVPRGVAYTSDDGQTWQERNNGLAEVNVLALAIDPLDKHGLFAATASGDVWRSRDGGLHWTMTAAPLPGYARANQILVWHTKRMPEPVLYVASDGPGVFRSVDQGDSWTALSDGLPELPVRGMAMGEQESGVLYVGAGPDVYRLPIIDNPTQSTPWQRMTTQPLNGQVTDILVYSRRPTTLYVATDGGAIYRQRKESLPWESLSPELLPFPVPAQELHASHRPWQKPLLWAITARGLFCSEDEGITWTIGNLESLQQDNVRSLATDDKAPEMIYVGTARSGLYRGRPLTAPIVSFAGYGMLILLAVGGMVALVRGRSLLRAHWQKRSRALLEQNWASWDAIIGTQVAAHEQVTPEMLEGIRPESRLGAMRRYVHGRKDLDLVLREEIPAIQAGKLMALQTLAGNWSILREHLANPQRATPMAALLTEELCELLGFAPVEARTFKTFFGYVVQAPTMRLGIPSSFPVIFVLKNRMDQGDIRDVRDLMNVLNVTSFFALLVLVEPGPASKERARSLDKQLNGADDFVFLDYADLRQLYLAADARRALIDIILSQVDLSVVSPYIISGPVPENMFFGRDYELKAVMRTIRDRNHAILGGRKIGKTSVLTKLHRMLQQADGYYPYYLDCEHIFNYRQFFSALSLACQPPGQLEVVDDLRHLAVCLRRRHEGSLTVFLFDEVDHLLVYDSPNHNRLFGMLRSLAREGLCRAVFCGERVLRQALHDPLHPLSNLVSTIQLGFLASGDALRMIKEPMAEMGIVFEGGDRLPQRIIDLSSCHPNLVQVICHMLIEQISRRSDRVIRPRDLEEVQGSVKFADFFLEVTWGDASTLGRLITVLMVKTPDFGLEELRQMLQRVGCVVPDAALEAALDELLLLSVLRRQGRYYTFAARSFPAIMQDANLAGNFGEALLEKLRVEQADR